MSITIRSFGHTREGRPVTLLRMENAAGACAEVLDYGARLQSMVVPDRDGKPRDGVPTGSGEGASAWAAESTL